MMGRMPRSLIRSERLKLPTTRTWIGLLIGIGVPLVGLTLLLALRPVMDDDGDSDRVEAIMSQMGVVSPFVFVLGVLVVTTEFRHGTAATTFTVANNRDAVLVAKLATGALAALAFALIAVGITLSAVPILAARDDVVFDGVPWGRLAGSALALGFYGALGVAVGAVFRNQVAALVVSLVYMLALEPAFSGIVDALDHPAYARYLVGSAAAALAGDASDSSSADFLPPWGGALLLAAYVLVFLALGMVVMRRDVG